MSCFLDTQIKLKEVMDSKRMSVTPKEFLTTAKDLNEVFGDQITDSNNKKNEQLNLELEKLQKKVIYRCTII